VEVNIVKKELSLDWIWNIILLFAPFWKIRNYITAGKKLFASLITNSYFTDPNNYCVEMLWVMETERDKW